MFPHKLLPAIIRGKNSEHRITATQHIKIRAGKTARGVCMANIIGNIQRNAETVKMKIGRVLMKCDFRRIKQNNIKRRKHAIVE